jgi:hypothetical protein
MGKSNSKLKQEVVEELTRKTYCECPFFNVLSFLNWTEIGCGLYKMQIFYVGRTKSL